MQVKKIFALLGGSRGLIRPFARCCLLLADWPLSPEGSMGLNYEASIRGPVGARGCLTNTTNSQRDVMNTRHSPLEPLITPSPLLNASKDGNDKSTMLVQRRAIVVPNAT